MYSFEEKEKNFCGQTAWLWIIIWMACAWVDDCECVECCATTQVNITNPFGSPYKTEQEQLNKLDFIDW